MWIAIFWFIVTLAISYTIGQLMMKKPHVDDLKAGKMDIPNSEEGKVQPVIFGTPRRIEDATLAWWGHVKTVEIKKKVSDGGWFHGDTYQTIGYKYYIGMLAELCHGPIDGIKQIFCADKLIWPDPDNEDTMAADGAVLAMIDTPKLFGGESSGGGVEGELAIAYGGEAQTPDEYLRARLAETATGALQGAHSIGASSLVIDGLAANKEFHEDDTLVLTTDAQRYTITADATANGSGVITISITPTLVENTADNVVATFRQDTKVPASRGLVSVIFKQIYFGTTPYLQPFSFLVKRIAILDDGSPQWYLVKAAVNTRDLNPAHIIRECITNTRWGMGYSAGLCLDSVWQPVADKLYSEGFGLSACWDGQKELLDFVFEICKCINGLLYQDLKTGQFILKLIRDDYVPASLTMYDESDIIAVEDFVRPSPGEIPDVVNVNFWNLKDNKNTVMPDHDIALMDAQGGKSIIYETSMPYVTDKDLAAKIASREARQISSMVATLKIRAKRTMATLQPGAVFKLNWQILGITGLVVRILKANYGTLQDGTIEFECMEDVWTTEPAMYATPPESGWIDPVTEPTTSPARLLIEAPFLTLVKNMGLPTAQALTAGAGFLMVGAVRSSGDAFNYDLLVRDTPASTFESVGYVAWTPAGKLTADMLLNATDATVTLDENTDLDLGIVGDYVQIDNELLKIKAIDAGNRELTLARGVLDSVPAFHSTGARVWLIESSKAIVQQEYASAATPGVKVLPRTGKGELDEASAAIDTASAFDSRQARPYPPGAFKINSVSYPGNFTGQPTISWTHRDRLLQTGEITEHSATSIGPEAGTTYTLKIYDENNVLRRTETGLTGTSYLYTEANERADCSLSPTDPLNTQLRFVLLAVRSGLNSWQQYDSTVPRA
jgi:hypothetical protein